MTDTPLAGRCILLVEDQTLIALEIEMALLDAGARVLGPAVRLSRGLEIAQANLSAIEAAILDIDLNGEDVFPLAALLRANDVPFLFHTGHGTRAALAAEFASVPVCTKPILTRDLIGEVVAILRANA